jgi:hypothetical protein
MLSLRKCGLTILAFLFGFYAVPTDLSLTLPLRSAAAAERAASDTTTITQKKAVPKKATTKKTKVKKKTVKKSSKAKKNVKTKKLKTKKQAKKKTQKQNKKMALPEKKLAAAVKPMVKPMTVAATPMITAAIATASVVAASSGQYQTKLPPLLAPYMPNQMGNIITTSRGILWAFDGGRRPDGKSVLPRLVGWDLNQNKVHREMVMPGLSRDAVSRSENFVIDEKRGLAYLVSHNQSRAGGLRQSLWVIDIAYDGAMREAVIEELSLSGSMPLPQIAMTGDGHTVMYRAGADLVRIRADDLANPALPAEILASRLDKIAP